MKQENYHCSITVDATPAEAMAHIKNVRGWWAKELEGSTEELNDQFKVIFGTTWVDLRVIENVPGRRLVWGVTDCYLPWLNDKKEWNGTHVVFDIRVTAEGCTRIDMIHIGLVPEAECFATCEKGWDQHIKGSLFQFLTQQEGMPV